MIPQFKVLADGSRVSWVADMATMTSVAQWARRDPARLRSELEAMHQTFPTWLVTVGQAMPNRGWPHARQVVCPSCGEMLVPDGGLRCLGCGERVTSTAKLLLGFVGRIPVVAHGRPFLDRVRATRGDYLIEVQGRAMFAPPLAVFCPPSFPRGEPQVMVPEDYFSVLGIPEEHVYPETGIRLCNYAHWYPRSVAEVLTQRVVPRMYVDLMLADLASLGLLRDVVAALGVPMHLVYNLAGRHKTLAARFQSLYRQAMEAR